MNIKINNMERADLFYSQGIADLFKMNEFMNTTFEFDAKIVEKYNRGM